MATADEAQATAQRAFELTRMHAGDDPLAMADVYASVAIAHNEAGEAVLWYFSLCITQALYTQRFGQTLRRIDGHDQRFFS